MNYGKLAFLPLLILSACGDDEGIAVRLEAAANSLPTTYATPNGDVTISSAHVAVESVELVGCLSVTGRILKALNPLPSAMAHSESSPTLLGTPFVVSLAGEQSRINIGGLEPPPGRYCGVVVHIGAADSDALGLSDGDFVGRSIRVSGTDAQGAFSYAGDAEAAVRVEFPELRLDDDTRNATVRLSVIPSLDSTNVRAASAPADTVGNLGWSVVVATD